MAARTDSAILHEIVRIIQERAHVPEKVRIRTKQYQITYLEDHRQRLEEAMRRRDTDRLGMLFGQLPGRIKYQMMKASRSKTATPSKPVAKPSARPTAKSAPKPAAKTVSKAAPKATPKPAAKPTAKPSAKSTVKSTVKSKPKAPARMTAKRSARA